MGQHIYTLSEPAQDETNDVQVQAAVGARPDKNLSERQRATADANPALTPAAPPLRYPLMAFPIEETSFLNSIARSLVDSAFDVTCHSPNSTNSRRAGTVRSHITSLSFNREVTVTSRDRGVYPELACSSVESRSCSRFFFHAMSRLLRDYRHTHIPPLLEFPPGRIRSSQMQPRNLDADSPFATSPHMDAYTNILRPRCFILSLPDEILIKVVEMTREHSEFPWVMCHVCRRLQTICCNYPHFWTAIHTSSKLPEAELALTRSLELPLHIAFLDPPDAACERRVFDFLIQCFHRVQSLTHDTFKSAYMRDPRFDPMSPMSDRTVSHQTYTPWTQLRYLVLRLCFEDNRLIGLLASFHAPNIQYLELDRLTRPCDLHCLWGSSSLRTLVLKAVHYPIDDFLKAIGTVPGLNSLVMIKCKLNCKRPIDQPRAIVRFPRLKTLDLQLAKYDMVSLLPALQLPAPRDGDAVRKVRLCLWVDPCGGCSRARELPRGEDITDALHALVADTLKAVLRGRTCVAITLQDHLSLTISRDGRDTMENVCIAKLELDPEFRRKYLNFLWHVAAQLLDNRALTAEVTKLDIEVPVLVVARHDRYDVEYISCGHPHLNFYWLCRELEGHLLEDLFTIIRPLHDGTCLLPALRSVTLQCLDIALHPHAIKSIQSFLLRIDALSRQKDVTFDVTINCVRPRENTQDISKARFVPDAEEHVYYGWGEEIDELEAELEPVLDMSAADQFQGWDWNTVFGIHGIKANVRMIQD